MAGIAKALHRHLRIGLDTSVFIYHIESSSRYARSAGVVFDKLADGGFTGVTSVLTLMEIAVKPLRLGRPDVAEEYEALLVSFPNLFIADLDRATMRVAADLRANHRLRPADAVQVAACIRRGATAFVTNDAGLRRVGEIQVLLLEDYIEE